MFSISQWLKSYPVITRFYLQALWCFVAGVLTVLFLRDGYQHEVKGVVALWGIALVGGIVFCLVGSKKMDTYEVPLFRPLGLDHLSEFLLGALIGFWILRAPSAESVPDAMFSILLAITGTLMSFSAIAILVIVVFQAFLPLFVRDNFIARKNGNSNKHHSP